jgi:hypothetical protein
MTQDLFDPLDLEVRRRLQDLSKGEPAPDAARARLSAALHLAGPPGAPSEATASGGAPHSLPVTSATPAAAARLARIVARSSTGWILGSAGVAAVLGAWLSNSRAPVQRPGADSIVTRPENVAEKSVGPASSDLSSRSRRADQVPAPTPEPSAAAQVRGGERNGPGGQAKAERAPELSLAAERRLLDAARAALVAGDPKGGLNKLASHAKQFPRGALAEEREALSVDALVAAGRYDDAKRHGEAFHARFPGSLFAASVAAALRDIP